MLNLENSEAMNDPSDQDLLQSSRYLHYRYVQNCDDWAIFKAASLRRYRELNLKQFISNVCILKLSPYWSYTNQTVCISLCTSWIYLFRAVRLKEILICTYHHFIAILKFSFKLLNFVAALLSTQMNTSIVQTSHCFIYRIVVRSSFFCSAQNITLL